MGVKIMRNSRSFNDGTNEVNGFVVNVIRFVGAQQVSATSRVAARHWGTITTPDGVVIDMGELGMTTPQIKKILSATTKPYNRGESAELKKLNQLREQLVSLGMDTAEVDARIEEEQERIEAAKASKEESSENQKKIKALNKEIKQLDKAKVQLESFGLSTTEVTWKIADLEAQIAQLR